MKFSKYIERNFEIDKCKLVRYETEILTNTERFALEICVINGDLLEEQGYKHLGFLQLR
jgi:hypothetical protein